MEKYLFVALLLAGFGCRPARNVQTTSSKSDSLVQRTESSAIQYSRFTTLVTDFVPLTYTVQVPIIVRDTITEYRTETRTVMVPAKTRETKAETGIQQQAKTESKAVSAVNESEVKEVTYKQHWRWYFWLLSGLVFGCLLTIFFHLFIRKL
jgi:hypothetical protein